MHKGVFLQGFGFLKICKSFEETGSQIPIGTSKKCFYSEGGEILEQVFQRSDGCTISENIQSLVGQSFEQPDPVKDVPAQFLGYMTFKGSFLLWFYDCLSYLH